MFLLTIFSGISIGTYYSGQSSDYSNLSGTEIQGESGSVLVPKADVQTFNIWESGLGYSMIILVSAIAVGGIIGLHIMGSGLSAMSQSIIFNGILFLGLWACLTVVSSMYLFDTSISTLLWVGLTLIYVIGFGTYVTGKGAED